MSHKSPKKLKGYVKCAYCGRENVPVSSKGYTLPHMQMDGRRCGIAIIPFPEKIVKK